MNVEIRHTHGSLELPFKSPVSPHKVTMTVSSLIEQPQSVANELGAILRALTEKITGDNLLADVEHKLKNEWLTPLSEFLKSRLCGTGQMVESDEAYQDGDQIFFTVHRGDFELRFCACLNNAGRKPTMQKLKIKNVFLSKDEIETDFISDNADWVALESLMDSFQLNGAFDPDTGTLNKSGSVWIVQTETTISQL